MGPYYVESIFTFDNTLIRLKIIDKERDPKKKRWKFGHIMSKFGVPYLPCSLVWTKISLDMHSSVYRTYLPKKFGHFGTKVWSCILAFDRNLITHSFWSPSFYAWRNPPRVIEIFWHWQKLNQGSHWGWLQIKHTISKPQPTIIDL